MGIQKLFLLIAGAKLSGVAHCSPEMKHNGTQKLIGTLAMLTNALLYFSGWLVIYARVCISMGVWWELNQPTYQS